MTSRQIYPSVILILLGCQPATEQSERTARQERSVRLAQVIEQYDAQGIHRTGTTVDEKSAHWLADWVHRAGFEPTLQAIPFHRVDTINAFLEVGSPNGESKRFLGIPLTDSATYTDATGIEGPLGELGAEARIAVVRWPPTAQHLPGFQAARTAGAHHGLVIVTGGSEHDLPPGTPSRPAAPGYALINADRYSDPYGKPVLQLPSETGPALVAARARKATGRLVVQVEKTPVEIWNVTTKVPGKDKEAAPIVVMTPRSGWWQVASERGGGLALWVELLYALKATPPQRTVHFVASTGHELGHIGLDHYLERHQDLIANAHLWLHLGANFAAAQGANIRLQASSQELLDRATEAMAENNQSPGVITPLDQRPYGEARNIHDGGGRYISLLGSNGHFHSPMDRWPDSVDMETLEDLTEAFIGLVQELANE